MGDLKVKAYTEGHLELELPGELVLLAPLLLLSHSLQLLLLYFLLPLGEGLGRLDLFVFLLEPSLLFKPFLRLNRRRLRGVGIPQFCLSREFVFSCSKKKKGGGCNSATGH